MTLNMYLSPTKFPNPFHQIVVSSKQLSGCKKKILAFPQVFPPQKYANTSPPVSKIKHSIYKTVFFTEFANIWLTCHCEPVHGRNPPGLQKKTSKQWDNLPTSTSFPAGFLPFFHQQYVSACFTAKKKRANDSTE